MIMALPEKMPCKGLPKSMEGRCSPKDGGTGYARHFIQQWSKAYGIPFVWMLDDNVQLCHELILDGGVGEYQPCSFTHVMNSLERLMLGEKKQEIVVKTESDTQGTTKRISDYVDNAGAPDKACPPESETLRQKTRDGKNSNPPEGGRNIKTVGDVCGRPGHYGIIGIERHGFGCRNSESRTEPFGVTHSVYSFCLLNVNSTVAKQAWYPIKMYWQDIEFNHVVDEKGLVVCKYRKFSHSKKNLQPIETRQPARVSRLTFQRVDIDLAALRRKYERGPHCVTNLDHLKALLTYLSEHVLKEIPVEKALYPREDRKVQVTDDTAFEFEPAAPMTGSPRIDAVPIDSSSGSILIVLLEGIQNESFGVLKHVVTDKVGLNLEKNEMRCASHLVRLATPDPPVWMKPLTREMCFFC